MVPFFFTNDDASMLGYYDFHEKTLAELKARFPELPAPDASVAVPVIPEGNEAAWLERTLAHNHELLAVQRALGHGAHVDAID